MRSTARSRKLSFIDLFCGCGGFSLGLHRAGFRCLAALDSDLTAIETFRKNLPHVPHILQKDLTKYPPSQLARLLGDVRLDLIAGGPPCQGFSTARQRDGANHGKRFIADDRRQLYGEFLVYVAYFQPRVFVMENVLGLKSAAGGEYFTRVQHEGRMLGYRITSQIADAFDLGVPQKRRRQFIIGVRGDLPGFFPSSLPPSKSTVVGVTLGAAIGDLPVIAAGNCLEERAYDLNRRRAHLRRWGKTAKRYLQRVLEISKAETLTAHCARPHSARDLRDFDRLREGESSAVAMRRGVRFEFPYNKENFKDRYTRQSRRKPCSTIVAHLSKDGLMFIHPTQRRSLTPREAARVQSFPDWFVFPFPRTPSFRLIGNAVPPLVGEAVGVEVKSFLRAAGKRQRHSCRNFGESARVVRDVVPQSRRTAAAWLQEVAVMDRRQLRLCEKSQFLRGWYSLFFLFPNLHPLNALDHGDMDAVWSPEQTALPGFESFGAVRFERSGWPVALELLGTEAWRRYEACQLTDKEFYCVDAQWLGLLVERTITRDGRFSRDRAIARRPTVRRSVAK